jgi:hypothetical protein
VALIIPMNEKRNGMRPGYLGGHPCPIPHCGEYSSKYDTNSLCQHGESHFDNTY